MEEVKVGDKRVLPEHLVVGYAALKERSSAIGYAMEKLSVKLFKINHDFFEDVYAQFPELKGRRLIVDENKVYVYENKSDVWDEFIAKYTKENLQ